MILKSLAGNINDGWICSCIGFYVCNGGKDRAFLGFQFIIVCDADSFGVLYYRYVGFYKGMQSAGAAVAWQVDTKHKSSMFQLVLNWSLTTLSYPLLVVLVMLAVKDETKAEEGTDKEANPSSNYPASVK